MVEERYHKYTVTIIIALQFAVLLCSTHGVYRCFITANFNLSLVLEGETESLLDLSMLQFHIRQVSPEVYR